VSGAAAPARLRVDARDTAVDRVDRHVLVAVREQPRLSWTVPVMRDEQQQIGYEVRLDSHLFSGTGSDPWMVSPALLAAHSSYAWAVRVLDERGEWSPWSKLAVFETGPFSFADWSSCWASVAPLTAIERYFTLGAAVSRARLHLTAQGLVRAEVNGRAVNADSSDPSRTDFIVALYRTYDVTDLLALGPNALTLTVAHGEWARTGLDPRALAALVIDLVDGSRVTFGTGESMFARSSEVETEQPFYLERHDATAGSVEAPSPVVQAAAVTPSTAAEPPAGVAPDPSPPIRVVSGHACIELSRVDDYRVFGISTNIAGRSRVVLVEPIARGTVVRVIHSEHLAPGGRVDTTNVTMPFDNGRERQVVEYVATGEPGQVLEPWFCYHGFAYLQVSGLPDDAVITVTARALHTDLEAVSHLTCDEPLVERVVSVGRRTLLNNVHGIPEDCPTRGVVRLDRRHCLRR
jgi:alpha-L-rhamnosidase